MSDHDGFARRLDTALAYMGMTQADLARSIAVKPQTINGIRSGKRPGYATIGKIAQFIGVSSDWLMQGLGPEPQWLDITKAHLAKKGLLADQAQRVQESDVPYQSQVGNQQTIDVLIETNRLLVEQISNQNKKLDALEQSLRALHARFASEHE